MSRRTEIENNLNVESMLEFLKDSTGNEEGYEEVIKLFKQMRKNREKEGKEVENNKEKEA